MSTQILRYVLVDLDNHELPYEYDSYDEAVTAATIAAGDYAVVERVYEYDDSQLLWTPDGLGVWPR